MKMILTPQEAAEQLQISVNEVLRMLADGRIKAFKVGARWKIPSDLLKKTIERWATEEAEGRKRSYENHQSDGGGSGGSADRVCSF